MKTYYATQDIEDMAARGISELVLDDDTVLTDLARDAALRLGVKLTQRGRAAQPAGAPTARPATPVAAPAAPPARPSGCQHGPLTAAAPPVATESKPAAQGGTGNTAGNTAGNTVVDQMVGLVRQLAGKK